MGKTRYFRPQANYGRKEKFPRHYNWPHHHESDHIDWADGVAGICERLEWLHAIANDNSRPWVATCERNRLRDQFEINKIAIHYMRFRCWGCHRNTVDLRHHIVPLSRGGTNSISNIVGLCNPCHRFVHPHLK